MFTPQYRTPQDYINAEVLGLPDIPSSQSHTREWIAITDKIAADRANPAKPLPYDPHRDKPNSYFKTMMNENVLLELQGFRRMLCSSQQNLSNLFTNILVSGNFEDRWAKAGPKRREAVVIEAFQLQESHNHFSLNTSGPEKTNCPELSWEILTKKPSGFLDLMKLLLLDNNDINLTEPLILENERFNRMIGWVSDLTDSPDKRAWLEMRRMTRTYYIKIFVHQVLASFEGRTVTSMPMTSEHSTTKETLEGMKNMIDSMLGPEAGKAYRREEAQRRKEMALYCDHCLETEDKEAKGKMSACSRCMKIGKEIRYCNRECQRAAWPHHKAQCGKPLDSKTVLESVAPYERENGKVKARIDIQPPKPGYRRSAHLLRQIELLNNFPKLDYVLGGEYSVSLDHPHSAAVFIIMRNRAMTSGDLGALLYLHRVFQNTTRTEAQLSTQLRNEYGDDWTQVEELLKKGTPPFIKPVLREHMDEAIAYLQNTKRFRMLDKYQPGGEHTASAIQVGRLKDVTALVIMPIELSQYIPGQRRLMPK